MNMTTRAQFFRVEDHLRPHSWDLRSFPSISRLIFFRCKREGSRSVATCVFRRWFYGHLQPAGIADMLAHASLKVFR